jgi:anti-sigma factor RsiW
MRCSSCEPLLDQYIERTLAPRVMLRVAKHVHACKACHALLHELRSVDGLLLGAKQPELPPNFTFAVMAEVRGMPKTVRRRIPAWAVLCGYLVGAWVGVVAAIAVWGGRWPQIAATFGSLQQFGAFRGLANAFHALAPATPIVAAGVASVLTLDAALFIALFVFYRSVRPRLAEHLATVDVP